MPTLAHYKKNYPSLAEAWDKFNTLLDKKVFFFKPKSYNERIKQYTQEVDTKAQITAIQTQVDTYTQRPWYSRFWFWLFDSGHISIKKTWLSYHTFRQQTQFDALTDDSEVTIAQLETFKEAVKTHTSSLIPSLWRKVLKQLLRALGELLEAEKTPTSVQTPPAVDKNHHTHEAGMQKIAGNKSQDPLMANFERHLRKQESAKQGKSSRKAQPQAASNISENNRTTAQVDADLKEDPSSTATSKVLVMSRGDGVIIQASVDDEKSYEEACWSYVFCCSFFELDWKEKDKDVLRQKFNKARHKLQPKIHPDKLPLEKFPSDWQNREYWMGYVREGRNHGFKNLAMIAQGLQVLLDNIIPYPTEEYQRSIIGQTKLAEAAATGQEFRQEIFKTLTSMEEVVEIAQGTDRLEERATRAEENSKRMQQETQHIEESRERMQQETQHIEQETTRLRREIEIGAKVLANLPGGQEELDRIRAECAAESNQPKQKTTTLVSSQPPTTEPERPTETPASTPPETQAASSTTHALIAQWQNQGPPGSDSAILNQDTTLAPKTSKKNTEPHQPPGRAICTPCSQS